MQEKEYTFYGGSFGMLSREVSDAVYHLYDISENQKRQKVILLIGKNFFLQSVYALSKKRRKPKYGKINVSVLLNRIGMCVMTIVFIVPVAEARSYEQIPPYDTYEYVPL